MAILSTLTKAQGTLTVTTIADTETLVLAGKTYTFQTTLTDSNGNVLIGADNTATMVNLAAAINLGAGAGTKYADSMTANPHCSAAASDETLIATAKVGGTVGDLIGCSDSLTSAAWDAATLGTTTAGAGSAATAISEAHARLTTILGVSQVTAHLLKDITLLINEMDGVD